MDARLEKCLAPVAEPLAEFEQAFRDSIGEKSGLAGAIADYLVALRGKRIRPALVLLSHRSQREDGPAAMGAAVAIELIHTATLLHDDVIDVSDRRRGKLSVNARWNNLAAVLMGDHLFARAFGILVALDNQKLLEVVSHATKRVASGELRQLQQNRNFSIDEREYSEIIADKTASLFGASCQAGMLEAGRNGTDPELYHRFGETLGLSFQIADDLLDYLGDSRKTGKETGNDIKEGKVTLPLIHALERASTAVRKEIISIAENYEPEKFERIYELIAEHGGFDYARARANELGERARECLVPLPESPYRESLEMLTDYTVVRNV